MLLKSKGLAETLRGAFLAPQVRTMTFPAQPPDLRRLGLGRESFAVIGLLALPDSAFYPVRVPRLATPTSTH